MKKKGKTSTFTGQHWLVIIMGFILFYFCNACMTDGMNVIAPRLAAERGWDYAYMLSFATLSGCVSVFGQLGFGLLAGKLGPRKTISLALLGAAGFFALYGFAQSIPVYVAALCGVVTCSCSYAYVGMGGLFGNWFPEKKGVASGYASIGIPFSTATSITAFAFLFSRIGFTPVMTGVSVILAGLSVLSFILLRDYPEERGVFPDGIDPAGIAADSTAENQQNSSPEPGDTAERDLRGEPFSLKKMLSIREMWLVGIMLGLFSIVTTGVMGQFVIRHQQMAFSESGALGLMTMCAIAGMVGSPVMGWIENRLGTIKGFRVCCAIFMAALLLNFTNVRWLVILSVLCLGIVITGTPIFLTSFLVNIFGRMNFKTAYAFAFPLSNLLGQTAFLFTALSLRIFGEIRYVYLLFCVMLLAAMILMRFLRMNKWNKNG